jgi:hypothetical protein
MLLCLTGYSIGNDSIFFVEKTKSQITFQKDNDIVVVRLKRNIFSRKVVLTYNSVKYVFKPNKNMKKYPRPVNVFGEDYVSNYQLGKSSFMLILDCDKSKDFYLERIVVNFNSMKYVLNYYSDNKQYKIKEM